VELGNNALGEQTLPELKRVPAVKRGGVRGFTTGCYVRVGSSI
jgi:hypothetical protein